MLVRTEDGDFRYRKKNFLIVLLKYYKYLTKTSRLFI